MGSIAARAVAQEVLETIGKGRKPHLGKIVRSKGYSEATSRNPQMVTQTDSYQEIISPLVKSLTEERDAIIKDLKRKRKKANYKALIEGLDKIQKNIQLLTGRATENVHAIHEVEVSFR